MTMASRIRATWGSLTGMSVVIVHAMDTGQGSYLPVAVVLALVSFISTSVVARFIEGRQE